MKGLTSEKCMHNALVLLGIQYARPTTPFVILLEYTIEEHKQHFFMGFYNANNSKIHKLF